MPREIEMALTEHSHEKLYCGIDNGVSGSIGIINAGRPAQMFKMPTFVEQDYVKEKRNITRVDVSELTQILFPSTRTTDSARVLVLLERPMVNPMRFRATVSAIRALEATLGVIEVLRLPRMYVGSRAWQKLLLPHGCEGEELKSASEDIGCRLFPHLADVIHDHGDADGLLISEWARRTGL